MSRCGGRDRDLAGGRAAFFLWCVPSIVILAGVLVPGIRSLLWIPSFLVMGIACVVNARGCGRRHCYWTGPVFLLAGVATALDALGMLAVDWKLVLAGVFLGTLLAYGSEWRRGKYAEPLGR